ncbi:MAG TPA: lytic transglycosylase domain-containing protein [Candidatus Acidoferrales bacterium]
MPQERLERIVQDAATKHNLDPALVKAVIGVESGWNQTAISRKGALGLMQLIPSTAGQMGVGNAFDPVQNVNGGAAYLRSLLDRFHGDLNKSLAAYNAGPGAVERVGGIPNIPETRSYVRKVTDSYFRPGSGRDPSFSAKPRIPVRREVDPNGRVVFTNE